MSPGKKVIEFKPVNIKKYIDGTFNKRRNEIKYENFKATLGDCS